MFFWIKWILLILFNDLTSCTKKKRFMDISPKNCGGVIFSLSYTELICLFLIVEKKKFVFVFIRINGKNRGKCYYVMVRLCHMYFHFVFFVSQLFSWKSLESEKISSVRIITFGQKLTSVELFEKTARKMHLRAEWGKNRNVL